jgi:hypothetical protein
MKRIILVLAFFTMLSAACKVKATKESSIKNKTATQESSLKAQEMLNNENKTLGKVSHKYKATGCSVVIEINSDGEIQTLIPKDKLAAEFDVDGVEIYFNFHVLRMPQPAGCTVGQPAEITDINLKKK